MDGSLLQAGEVPNQHYEKGTVGEFLQRGGAGLSMHNAWQPAFFLAFLLAALVVFVSVYGARVDELAAEFANIELSTAGYAPVLVFLCAVAAVAGVALLVYSLRTRGSSHDRRRQLRTQVLSMMVGNDRFPVGMRTQLSTLSLRCLYIKGSRAIECSSRYPYVSEDFARGSMSSQSAARLLFDAYDYEVVGGRLLVYYDAEAAESVRERRYAKGAKGHG